MAEDYDGNLSTYKAQLHQVEAALTSDADNEELLKLKQDLQEVIDLTLDLIKAAPEVTQEEDSVIPLQKWNIGDRCLAMYEEDGLLYPSTIDEIHDNGTVTVTFDGYGNSEIVKTSKLRELEEPKGEKRTSEEAGLETDSKPKSKKELLEQQKEYKKRKQQKKAERLKQMEQAHEKSKNNWLDFNSKAFNKNKKGYVKKSIFASPDESTGKVGVGTCNKGGKPMTKFQKQKYQVPSKK
ncbi:survival of motor neuron-related-splicing factor 30-like [Anneissia japonica]|uniref:survival of motor neuron-related-splicing factor 30-like n=1 Tax=Anneissia japonica TaxID=1529436 RepID=UPI00142570A7|nr:survival of motor neuron-related-splicing factor 30-like [Anneissia japonica]